MFCYVYFYNLSYKIIIIIMMMITSDVKKKIFDKKLVGGPRFPKMFHQVSVFYDRLRIAGLYMVLYGACHA